MRSIFQKTILAILMAMASTLSVQAQVVPTITTDKADYLPGEVAHLYGAGWLDDQTVHVEFVETPDYPDFHIYDVTVAADGSWQIDYPIELRHLGVSFTVNALG